MKKIYLLFVSFLFLGIINIYAQTTTVVPKNIKLDINAVKPASITIDLVLEMNDNDTFDTDFWLIDPSEKPQIETKDPDQKQSGCELVVNPSVSPKSISVKVMGFSPSTLKRFLNRDKINQITLEVKHDVKIKLISAPGDPAKFWLLKSDVVNKMINEQLSFSDSAREDFLSALNNFYYYENMVDFGVQPGSDSTKTDYILSLRLQNVYNRKNILKCDDKNTAFPLYWSLDTRLSTNFSDSLNYIKFYPLSFLYEDFSRKIPYQFNMKLGHESSQDFKNRRVALDASLNFIIPNLVNLTTVQSNRLRLKPVITAGLKGYYDYTKDMESLLSGLAHIDGHYYIPVFNNYAIIIDGGIFYDLSKERNPGKKVQGNYSITLGAEIPKTGFKAMFKYVDGKTDINYKQGSIIAVGLLMDFLQERNKPH